MRGKGDDFEWVKHLVSLGLSDYKIAAKTGVPRSTVLRWRRRDIPPYALGNSPEFPDWRPNDASIYCYLLGAYLGDGTLWTRKGTRLQIVNDRRYPKISEEILTAMAITFPPRTPRSYASSVAESEVLCISHPAVLQAFPQHGPGRKHLRRIELAAWQQELTHAHPAALIRGLVHSDGCRVVNRFKTKLPSGRIAAYSYVRYFFSNLSEDIRNIFKEHCELLGIRVTQSNHRNLTVSHRHSVAVLEELVGPKT